MFADRDSGRLVAELLELLNNLVDARPDARGDGRCNLKFTALLGKNLLALDADSKETEF